MKNIAYTVEYKTKHKQYEAVFIPENLKETEQFKIEHGYHAERKQYAGEVNGFNIQTSETVVFSPDNSEVYRYRNIDDNAEFITLIHHSNGRKYLIFRIDLYGYGVFDLADKKEFFFIPDEPETFIWTQVYYNPANDMLAVSGCIWACPFSLILLDFKDPMAETKWVDIHIKLDSGYEKYDDIDFVRWDKTALIVKAEEIIIVDGEEKSVQKEFMIEETQYIKLQP